MAKVTAMWTEQLELPFEAIVSQGVEDPEDAVPQGPVHALLAALSEQGCPVILCTPRPGYDPQVGKGDLEHPAGWQGACSDFGLVEQYTPGWHTPAMVSGHGLDVIDIDPKNGASVEEMARRAEECGVKILGRHRTPSGGAHLFVASTGIATSNKPAQGVDFRGGCEDGSGRGLVYLPGATRPKYPGIDYQIEQPIDCPTLPELDLDEQRDAQWALLRSVGITPRLSASRMATAAGAGGMGHALPSDLRSQLADHDVAVGRRSERAHHLIGECFRAGLTLGQTVAAMTPWCEGVGKYVGRVEAEVARSWAKVAEDGAHSGHPSVPPTGLEGRHLVLTTAAQITPRPTTWLWQDRMPGGSLCLIAGPEGTGKSTCAYWLAAQITRGTLPGIHYGTPKNVFVAATEDSWAMTIVPRLIAADADLSRIYRLEVVTSAGTGGALTLPKDVPAMEEHVRELKPALLLLDPIMSRVDASLDTHRDQETRQALEPIAGIADRHDMAVLGLIHFNKSESGTVLNNVMASKAFTAVARSVSVVVRDPDDETGTTRIFATVKNNLGRDALPLLPFQISEHTFTEAGQPIRTSRIDWLEERDDSIHDLIRESRSDGDRSIVQQASDWLSGFLDDHDGCAARKVVMEAGQRNGFSEDQLKRAFRKSQLEYRNGGFPRTTYWMTTDKADAWDAQHSRDEAS